MSEKWIESNERLIKTVGKDKADEIMMEKLLDPKNVGEKLIRIDKNSNIKELDIDR
ncbi:hypothetical protein [Metabacillus fastidiosus]|uniref:Uncharacterized protein n=1 Tax=Metabacillus fastidiosus TaxID=1458 RepID=A0ABU6P0F2_9BACI|nr:hypothetical protein [Metabacillus fastidiosus]MED4401591.1 hypothetical protein [Metabacillus fastidiosus]MED4463226.1 hypothetical protein [Metabacillus fastidiosus]